MVHFARYPVTFSARHLRSAKQATMDRDEHLKGVFALP